MEKGDRVIYVGHKPAMRNLSESKRTGKVIAITKRFFSDKFAASTYISIRLPDGSVFSDKSGTFRALSTAVSAADS